MDALAAIVDLLKPQAVGAKIIRSGGETWYGHTGSDPGVSARVAFTMDGESSIIVLCNAEDVAFQAFRLARQWLDG